MPARFAVKSTAPVPRRGFSDYSNAEPECRRRQPWRQGPEVRNAMHGCAATAHVLAACRRLSILRVPVHPGCELPPSSTPIKDVYSFMGYPNWRNRRQRRLHLHSIEATAHLHWTDYSRGVQSPRLERNLPRWKHGSRNVTSRARSQERHQESTGRKPQASAGTRQSVRQPGNRVDLYYSWPIAGRQGNLTD